MKNSVYFVPLISAVFLLSVALWGSSALSDEAVIKKGPRDTTEFVVPEEEEDMTKQEVRDMAFEYAKESLQEVTYYEPTIQNLSRLYWSLGMFSLDDVGAIDTYLMINECQIYKDYYHDDFEWKAIVDMTRDSLESGRKSFPRRFYFIREINLGRYNFNTESFYVVDQDLREGTRRHEMRIGSKLDEVCGFTGFIPGYSRNINLTLSRPFKLKYVPVAQEKAHDFVTRTHHDNREAAGDGKNKILNYDRTAFVRIRVRILKFLEMERSSHEYLVASVFAVLEGYDICEDRACASMLFSTGH